MKKKYSRRFLHLLRSKTSKFISALLVGNLINTMLGFFTSVIILRKLPTEEIGLIYPLLSLLMLTEQLGDLGLTFGLIKVATTEETQLRYSNLVFRVKLGFALLISAVGLLFSPWISENLFHNQEHLFWIRVTLLITIPSGSNAFYGAFLQIKSQFFRLSFTKVFPNILKFVMIAGLSLIGIPTFGQVYTAFFIVPLGIFVLSVMLSGTSYLKAESNLKRDFPEIFHFTKWILLSNVAVSLIGQLDLFMLRSIRDAEEVARYVGGSRLASILLIATSAAITALLPKVSSYKTRRELRAYFHRTLFLVPPLSIAVVLASLTAPWFVPFILGAKYMNSVSVFIIFNLQFAVDLLCTPLSLILYRLNRVYIFSYMNISQLLLLFISNLLLVPKLGAEGAALSGLVIRCMALMVILYYCKVEKIMSWKNSDEKGSHEI